MKFSIVLIFQKTASLFLLFFIAQQLLNFPVFKFELITALIVYIITLNIYSKLWLIILPAILPILDLSPWSGRYLITEFDLLILITLSVSLFFNRVDFSFFRNTGSIKWLILLMILSYTVSTIIGFLSLKAFNNTAFYLYPGEYNSLRVAKGFFSALLLLPVLSYEQKQAYEKKQGSNISTTFSIGMLTGLILVIISILWERIVFPGLFDFTRNYRVSGLFSGMRSGGIMLDAYLFLTFPFILFLFYRSKSAWLHGLALIIFTGGIYSILVTYTRINYLTIIIVLFILSWGHLQLRQSSLKISGIHYFSLIVITLLISISIYQGGYITQRFANTVSSFEHRIKHWNNTLKLTENNIPALLLGHGIGAYPGTFLKKETNGRKIARFWLKQETNNEQSTSFLRFSPSDQHNLNVVQRFSVTTSGKYTITVRLRNHSDKAQILMIEFCKKNILPFDAECQWLGFQTRSDSSNNWQTLSKDISFEPFLQQSLHHISPFDINLLNRGLHNNLDINLVEIFSPDGKQLLSNTQFKHNFDHWYFSSANATPWTIDNLWVTLFFETGIIGLTVFVLFTLLIINNLINSLKKGSHFSLMILSSLSGILIIGLMGSTFDEPRISWLFYFMIYLAILKTEK